MWNCKENHQSYPAEFCLLFLGGKGILEPFHFLGCFVTKQFEFGIPFDNGKNYFWSYIS